MSTNRTDTPTDTPQEHPSCGMSLEQHVLIAMSALHEGGLALGCEMEYRALLVIAETSRQLNGHRDYDPGPEAAIIVAGVREATQSRAVVPETAQTKDAIVLSPDNGKVH